jgi:hypothetical protein
MVSYRMGDQNLISRGPTCFGRHVKPLVLVAFALVSRESLREKPGQEYPKQASVCEECDESRGSVGCV